MAEKNSFVKKMYFSSDKINFILDKNVVKKYMMQEIYGSTVRLCALILEILLKLYVTEFPYRRYHGSSKMYRIFPNLDMQTSPPTPPIFRSGANFMKDAESAIEP